MPEYSEYAFQKVREDNEYVVLRGQRFGDSKGVLAVAPSKDAGPSECLARLEHALSLREVLDEGWAARPLALEKIQGRVSLLVEDPGGIFLDDLVTGPMELGQFLRLSKSIAAALGSFHRLELIHKDIKPGNILVDLAAGQVWLSGFGMASPISRGHRLPIQPHTIAGTLAYMAPEQTGHMNRSVDPRSDLYAFGTTLYQMLTGSLPFAARDIMEWVHCHIARTPPSPSERLPRIPPQVSAITMKLLAKNPEDRYQTAAGLEADLDRCLKSWNEKGEVDSFSLGLLDVSDRLRIPERVYGRETHVSSLLSAFRRVSDTGRPEVVLIQGPSGIGKSTVVLEFQRALLAGNGLFAVGKQDLQGTESPYSAIAQAFEGLLQWILSQDPATLGHWKQRLLKALGPNGQLIASIIPGLDRLIGAQPSVPGLLSAEERVRLHLVFREFVAVFASKDHPLVLFLDDLHRLDRESFLFIQHLLVQSDVQHLLLVGAYREVEAEQHPALSAALAAVTAAGVPVQTLSIGPLDSDHVEHLLSDAFRCGRDQVRPLARTISTKTSGNPFFINQFITALVEEGDVAFNHQLRSWEWNLGAIQSKSYTDNVADLLVESLSRLSPAAQDTIRILACLGYRGPRTLLASLRRIRPAELDATLYEAMESGLVASTGGEYQFLHDRIQEAAYAFIPHSDRPVLHLQIARLILDSERSEEALYAAVAHFKKASPVIPSDEERVQVAKLNLAAARRSRISSAYDASLVYLGEAKALLHHTASPVEPDLNFAIELMMAECEILTANQPSAEKRLLELRANARRLEELASVAEAQLALYVSTAQYERAASECLTFLRSFGGNWPDRPTDSEVQEEYATLRTLIGHRPIKDLVHLPLATESEPKAILAVCAGLVGAAYYVDMNLFCLTVLRMANRSLREGHAEGSPLAFALLTMVCGAKFKDFDAGFEFGSLGLSLVETKRLKRYEARVRVTYANVVMPWTCPLRQMEGINRKAFDAAQESGDLLYAMYSLYFRTLGLMACGEHLGRVKADAEAGLALAVRSQLPRCVDYFRTLLSQLRNLLGDSKTFGSFDDGESDAQGFESHIHGVDQGAILAFYYWSRVLQTCYYAGDITSAVKAAAEAESGLWTSSLFLDESEFHFYASLARLAALPQASPEDRAALLQRIRDSHQKIKTWAERCPDNFSDRVALLDAELLRVDGEVLEAESRYEEAISLARRNAFLHVEGLANELAGRFYAERGLGTISRAYFTNARRCFQRWGAVAKVLQLDQRYGLVDPADPSTSSVDKLDTSLAYLDLSTVVKALQAVSGEIVLPKLIETLMRSALQRAGADRGLLIQFGGKTPIIQAVGTVSSGGIEVAFPDVAVSSWDVPEGVLQYLLQTGAPVLVADSAKREPAGRVFHLEHSRARSLLCLPIVNRAKLVGALHLENTLSPNVFTPDRIAILELLASQAAISLDNARLYTNLEKAQESLAWAQRLSSTGSFGWRPATGEIVWSEETYRIFEVDPGVTPTIAIAMERTHPDDRVGLQEQVRKSLTITSDIDYEARLVMPDGRLKYIEVSARAPKAGSHSPVEFVGSVRDVTALKESEHTLNGLRTELARVTRVAMLGQLTGSIAHEVNQPLAGIVMNGSACMRWLDGDSPKLHEARTAVERIIRDGKRAGAVIARLKALFGKSGGIRTEIDLNEAISEVLTLIRPEIQNQRIALHTEFESGLPAVRGDRVQLQQVILNLLVNAKDAVLASPHRPRELHISSSLRNGTDVLIAVKDSGIGIPSGDTERMFNAYYSTKQGSMGMGLSIGRFIIETHGGKLWAEPNAGPGATFLFTIPAST